MTSFWKDMICQGKTNIRYDQLLQKENLNSLTVNVLHQYFTTNIVEKKYKKNVQTYLEVKDMKVCY